MRSELHRSPSKCPRPPARRLRSRRPFCQALPGEVLVDITDERALPTTGPATDRPQLDALFNGSCRWSCRWARRLQARWHDLPATAAMARRNPPRKIPLRSESYIPAPQTALAAHCGLAHRRCAKVPDLIRPSFQGGKVSVVQCSWAVPGASGAMTKRRLHHLNGKTSGGLQIVPAFTTRNSALQRPALSYSSPC